MVFWKSKFVPVLAALVVCASCCYAQLASAPGKIERVQEIASEDAARALGVEMYKFSYALEPGHYDTDIWLEQVDTGSTEVVRLTHGKSSNKRETEGGNIVIGISDPATTRSEKNNTWRVAISRQEGDNAGSSRGFYLIPNPFEKWVGAWMRSAIDSKPIRLREEITLVTWASGEPVKDVDGSYKNARTVYLKMEIMPQGELMR